VFITIFKYTVKTFLNNFWPDVFVVRSTKRYIVNQKSQERNSFANVVKTSAKKKIFFVLKFFQTGKVYVYNLVDAEQ